MKPSTRITWFQALAACRNAGKSLATNQEWQAAAFGVPNGDNGGSFAGPLAVVGRIEPSVSSSDLGFRCVRDQ